MIIYTGSYTTEVLPGLEGFGKGISTFNLNEDTGELTLLHMEENVNTAYLVISKDQQYLYSFQEVMPEKNPHVLAYKINEDKSLTLINKQPILGGLPCHINLINDDKTLLVACYWTGNVHVYQLNDNGSVNPHSQILQHKGSSVNKDRQEAAHMHMVYEHNHQIFVPDLGLDKVVVYDIEEGSKLKEAYRINTPLGGGPRHLVIHPKGMYGFLMNELTGDVSTLKLKDDKFEVIDNVNSLPSNYKDTPSSSAIKLSKDGRFLYCSNRGCETVTIFEFKEETGALNIINYQETSGKTPRDFNLSPCGRWLLVANQDSFSIETFKVDTVTGMLNNVYSNKEIRSVSCIQFL
ncbi:lactonase family protein [Seonamhaeicola marinus]|uniref:Lactonase family protein n=1 Tax=Seonamhaeicola marinus TaxID=1912246 RepID=A0A5D0J9H0_9FLAO|nr:lactonase family protein [Seonamhaeicola marinus]TYA92161.1 lactonase family protein [Seonamhaeicola marinus]